MRKIRFHALAITTICLVILGLNHFFGGPKEAPVSEIPQPGEPQVNIISATWGANCNTEIDRLRAEKVNSNSATPAKPPEPVKTDNVLKPIRTLCESRFSCALRADAATFGFDPIDVCHKQLVVSYRCFAFDLLHTLTIGQGEPLKIDCRAKAKPAEAKPSAPATPR